MYKIYQAIGDTYITNRVIDGDISASYHSNVGYAGTLDLFKLYGVTSSGSQSNLELSRILLKFDLTDLRSNVSSGNIDITSNKFSAYLKLFDVYGGQPCPVGFYVSLYPLSKSWDEGLGKDIVYYGDADAANYLTASGITSTWVSPGASASGSYTSNVDIISQAPGLTLPVQQYFTAGTENLYMNITSIISASIAGIIPDAGFRISYASSHEIDQSTYFVKRFSSRHAYDMAKRPRLIISYDNSIVDDTSNIQFDRTCSLCLYSFDNGSPVNLTSGSSTVSGLNCIRLDLVTDFSGSTSTGSGSYRVTVTGSQLYFDRNPMTGIYSASVYLRSTDPYLKAKLALSESVKFTPYWSSIDQSVCYFTGSQITVTRPQISNEAINTNNVTVTCNGISDSYEQGDIMYVRVDIFDSKSPYIKLVKTPAIIPSKVQHNVYYSIVDIGTGEAVVPFETESAGTKCSTDASGVYFKFDTSSLIPNRTYRVDIMFNFTGAVKYYRDVSNYFRVINTE